MCWTLVPALLPADKLGWLEVIPCAGQRLCECLVWFQRKRWMCKRVRCSAPTSMHVGACMLARSIHNPDTSLIARCLGQSSRKSQSMQAGQF
eukprot:1156393-Pelagomonas_calceolata.AAC.6